MFPNRRHCSKSAQFGSFLQKLTFFVVLSWGAFAFGNGRPSVRVFTFAGDNAWEAMASFYRPTPDGFYKQEKSESSFRVPESCNDHLGLHQKRALEVMLENRYITKELYEQLRASRVHDMRQYILVTLFTEMPMQEAIRQGIPQERLMDDFNAGPNGEIMVRVHEGSLFAVRGYDIKRTVDSFGTKDLKMPWEIGTIPKSLQSTLDRTNIPGAVEFGRALVEKGAPPGYFQLMMSVAVSALAADLRILGIDPNTVPAMAHAYDAEHARLFSAMFRGRPMTPEMQRQLEADPRAFLAALKRSPMPKKGEWEKFDDAVIVNSMANIIEQYPVDSISEFSNELKKILPATVTAEQRQNLIIELANANREDYDFTWHDPHRPGHRFPLQIHDFGTGFFFLNFKQLIRKVDPAVTDIMVTKVIELIKERGLDGDPDFTQGEWFDKQLVIPFPPYKITKKTETPPTMVISNLDPKVPSNEMESYLGKILVSVAEKIEHRLKTMTAEDHRYLLEEMNMTRGRRGLKPVPFLSLPAFLETYDVVFSTSDTNLATRLKMIGGTITKAIQVSNSAAHGPNKLKFDPSALGIEPDDLEKNPDKVAMIMGAFGIKLFKDMLNSAIQFSTVYRFEFAEVEEQRQELGPAAAHSLSPSYHRQKLMRYYITYQ